MQGKDNSVKDAIKILNGERVQLRQLAAGDMDFAQKMFDIVSSRREYFRMFDFNLADRTIISDVNSLAHWLRGMVRPLQYPDEAISYVIYFENKIIGMITLEIRFDNKSAKPSFWIHPDYAGRGFMTDAMKLIQELSFNHYELHRLDSGCYPENVASCKLHERLGFTAEGIARDSVYDPGDKKFYSLRKYGQLSTEYK
jgi:RimJ/RimL family protein N-acetyltransferase